MQNEFDFNNLFVFEMANNHQGDLEHGKKIIQEMGRLTKMHGIRAAVKFQFRQMDTFIHPSHQKNSDNKHIPRFLSTKLGKKEFQALFDEVRKNNLITMCTPFDEASVDLIEEMDFDVIKVGSCSAKDWPLLERVAEAGKPVIFSTGGLTIRNIDNLVSFFDHRGIRYAIMHCVSIYPIPEDKFNLSNIEMLRNRYPKTTIGWSTHEEPNELSAVQIAYAKGARMYERHVGIANDKVKLNTYSSTPEQINKWIESYQRARLLCGEYQRPEPAKEEMDSIKSLARGIYLNKDVKVGSKLERSQVFFAMPCGEGQLPSGEWRDGFVVKEELKSGDPVLTSQVEGPADPPRLYIQRAVHQVKALLNEARVHLSSEFKVEYSHHYGLENFSKFGAVLIECINREYCKKVIVQLPGQTHPSHYHKLKEETFQVLYGTLHVEIDGHHRILNPGETLLVLPGVWHKFWTETGVVAEEISTTHFNNDSVYQDKHINETGRDKRKTLVDHWGRFQLSEVKKNIPAA